ncbi:MULTISPECIES: helix-turn-helix domain-containing protein [Bacillaceae]|uniref:helix-turn-helix domain-containing protein n=1 Tax=Bacillaceae TaxID=186817 RepID=UPI001DB64022|nr:MULTISPECIES: helix-turn-helix domain-containing protein [Bacillaceae]CAH0298397.1 hypothetical protein SRABI134_04559 [Peribacillus sp. Bi134]
MTNGNQRDVPITVTDNQEGWEGDEVEWYTQKEVADLLGVSKATVYHYGKQKKIIKIWTHIDSIKRPVMKKRNRID